MKKGSGQMTSSSNSKQRLLTKIIHLLASHIFIWVRRLTKGFLHLVTKQTELERICVNEKRELARINKLGNSLHVAELILRILVPLISYFFD